MAVKVGKAWHRKSAARKSKYRNVRMTTADGTFDSKGEMHRWLYLKDQKQRGTIHGLERQVRFPIEVNGIHICYYVADFVFIHTESGLRVVEDFKGFIISGEFKLKKKLLMALHGIDVRIVKSASDPVF
jgi:hypothetical protein